MKRVLCSFHFLLLVTVLLCGPAKIIASNIFSLLRYLFRTVDCRLLTADCELWTDEN
jgi:hypothetical protein